MIVSVPSSQRHGTWWPCSCTPPIHRSSAHVGRGRSPPL